MSSDWKQTSRITRSNAGAKASCKHASRWYGSIPGWSGKKAVECGTKQLHAVQGESILGVGRGTGRSVVASARSMGETGRVRGIGLSDGMHEIAAARVERAGLPKTADLR